MDLSGSPYPAEVGEPCLHHLTGEPHMDFDRHFTISPLDFLFRVYYARPSDATPLDQQRKHLLRNMYHDSENPIRGGRDCVMCTKGVGHYSTGGRSP